MGKIVIARPGINETEREMIEKAAAEGGYTVDYIESSNDSAECLLEAEIIYGEGKAALKAVKESNRLKWLCASFAGVDAFCKPGVFKNEDAILTNSAGAYGVSLSEHSIMLAIMMMRRTPYFYDSMKNRTWKLPVPQDSIKDSVVALFGTGDTGTCLAKRLKGFEPAKIIGINRSGRDAGPDFDETYDFTRLAEVFPQTDLLIMSLPATKDTYHIINEETLALLPAKAYIVNVGRGNTIDGEALAAALNAGKLQGAALDVMETEPLPQESPLWEAKNILLTPHVAGNLTVPYTKRRNTVMFCEDLVHYIKGEPMEHLVDRNLGY